MPATMQQQPQPQPEIGWQQRERAQTTLDASFGPLVRIIFYFFLFLLLTIVLLNVYRLYFTKYTTVREKEAGEDEEGPKRRWTRRLGH
jgi:hypothetical protein